MAIAVLNIHEPADEAADRKLRLRQNKYVLLTVMLAADPKLSREDAIAMLKQEGLET